MYTVYMLYLYLHGYLKINTFNMRSYMFKWMKQVTDSSTGIPILPEILYFKFMLRAGTE